MKEKKDTVALLYGGRGYEHEVSLLGAKRVYPKIDKEKFDRIPILITKSGLWLTSGINRESPPASEKEGELSEAIPAIRDGAGGFLTDGGFIKVDAVFPLLHGDFGEDGSIAGVLENVGISYVGQDVQTGALLTDKAYTKTFAERIGIPTVPWIYSVNETADLAQRRAEDALGYPLFIKPARLGSSVGAGRADTPSKFQKIYGEAKRLGNGRVIIEKAVNIRSELECAYFGTKSKELFTKVGEISTHGGFYDYNSKYGSDQPFAIRDSAEIDPALEEEIRRCSKELVCGIGIRDLARIDFFFTEEGELFFNEINPMPGFTAESLYMRLVVREGISEESALTALIESALARRV